MARRKRYRRRKACAAPKLLSACSVGEFDGNSCQKRDLSDVFKAFSWPASTCIDTEALMKKHFPEVLTGAITSKTGVGRLSEARSVRFTIMSTQASELLDHLRNDLIRWHRQSKFKFRS